MEFSTTPKKYRRWYKEGRKDGKGFKSNAGNKIERVKEKNKARKEVKAEQYKEQAPKVESSTKVIQPRDVEEQTLFEPVNMKRIWRNKLFGDYDIDRPALRDYDRL